jgi:hypothetical protein
VVFSIASGLPFGGGKVLSGAMKCFSSLILVVACLVGISCERHEFEGPNGTKQLHKHGSGHSDKHAEDHAEDHAEEHKAAH